VWTAFFSLLGTWLVVEATLGESPRRWPWLIAGAGVAFGLGTAAKFNVVPVWGVCGVAVLWRSVRARRWPEAVFICSALILLPVLAYLATWWPWFGAGYSTREFFAHELARLETMAAHTPAPVGVYRFGQPSLWFIRPFDGWGEKVLTEGGARMAFTVGNPLTWWLVLPAAAWALLRNRQRPAERAFMLLFAASWLAMVAPTRPIWMLSSLTVVPFALGLVALAAADLEARWRSGAARLLVTGWLLLAVVVSLALFPALIGRAHQVGYLQPLLAHMKGEATRS
jgi:4-amino-4-deoxy-L-arabinose transferase-like glycosyltransferase